MDTKNIQENTIINYKRKRNKKIEKAHAYIKVPEFLSRPGPPKSQDRHCTENVTTSRPMTRSVSPGAQNPFAINSTA
jgi:hypothetical protein